MPQEDKEKHTHEPKEPIMGFCDEHLPRHAVYGHSDGTVCACPDDKEREKCHHQKGYCRLFEDKRECSCLCHDPKWKSGLEHDNQCCEKTNGILKERNVVVACLCNKPVTEEKKAEIAEEWENQVADFLLDNNISVNYPELEGAFWKFIRPLLQSAREEVWKEEFRKRGLLAEAVKRETQEKLIEMMRDVHDSMDSMNYTDAQYRANYMSEVTIRLKQEL